MWVGVILAVATGCQEKKLPTPPPRADVAVQAPAEVAPATPTSKIVKDEGPMPTPDTPIATAGDFKVTVADFEEASAISLLFAPDDRTELPKETMALPHVHVTMARSLLSQRVIGAELERRGIKPTTEELNAYLREHPRLGRFGQHIDEPEALKAALDPLRLEPKQLLRIAWEELGNQMLANAMVEDIKDEDIWQTYRFQNTTRTAIVVETRNIGTSEEIDQWMGDHAAEIDDQFQQHPNKYRIPRRVRLNIVKPEPGKNATNVQLEEAAKLLKKGVQPATIAKELNLTSELGAELIRGENQKAFHMKAGEVGWTDSGARGAYAWKVVGFSESSLPEMTRPLRREIAAELMRTTVVAPSLEAKLDKAAKALAKSKFGKDVDKHPEATDAVRQQIEALGGLSFQVVKVPNNPNAPLPKLGLAEEVIQTVFAAKVGETSKPFLSRERAFIVRVVETHEAERKEFDANIDANRRAFVATVKPRVVTQWVEQRLNELGATIDVKPLRIKYGVLQKE